MYKFKLNDLVCKAGKSGKRGRICAMKCPTTGRWKVKWGEKSTWVDEDKLVKVEA